ncbi:GNAT family N-acetyltransferase [Celeribacter persicus]|nr:GNAT family N-acetyltransferase [Celeribacter persicus]
MSETFFIRPATRDDALPIAKVQVSLWRATYRGIVPDALIDRMTVSDREKGWGKILDTYAASGRGAVFVAEQSGAVVGFLSCGDQRDADLAKAFPGEFSALYVSASRQGIGSALMAASAQGLLSMGHEAAALWVLTENAPARAFYEALGGTQVAERIDTRPEGGLSEVAYGWSALSALAARA